MSLITNYSLKSRKKQKVDKKIQEKKEILRKQKEQKDYYDEYEDYSLDSSFDKSDCDKPSLDLLNSNNEIKDEIEKSRKEEGMHKGLADNKEGILLENNKSILKLI